MPSVISKLTREFYTQPTLMVAEELIGKFLVYKSPVGTITVRLVEVEAYIGEDDPACHAAVGRTARNEIMYGWGGFSYVYLIYGMYHCLNIVTEDEGYPAAVLIRGAEPIEGLGLMNNNSGKSGKDKFTNGPGKLCRALNLNREHNGLDLTGNDLYLEDRGYKKATIERSRRIGIKKGTDRLWRIFEKGSPYLSGNKK
ncbi:MAG: DNA-3-methyladenine glycosylase [Candidatus Zixiibacteriota bacterium]